MKKTSLLATILIFSAISTQAQISKGSLWLGGNIGFVNSKNQSGESSKSSYYSVSPAVGTAVKKNTIVGIQFNFDQNKYSNDNNDQKVSHYGVDLFLREYWTIVNRLYAFGHYRVGYLAEKKRLEYAPSKEESNGWSIGLGAAPGISFELSKRFQLETMFYDLIFINYVQSENDVSNPSGNSSYKSHSVSGGVNFDNFSNLTLGVRFLLNK